MKLKKKKTFKRRKKNFKIAGSPNLYKLFTSKRYKRSHT